LIIEPARVRRSPETGAKRIEEYLDSAKRSSIRAARESLSAG